MKKIALITVVALVLALALAACAPATSAPVGETFGGQIAKAGTLIVGTSPDYPPYESLDEKGNLVGFDIEMMNALGKAMNLTIEFKQMDFSTIISALQASQVDVGLSGFTYDKERDVLFTTGYLKTAQVAVVKKDGPIKTTKDLEGKKLYAGLGTTGEIAISDIEGAEQIMASDYLVAFEMLRNGQIDGVVCDLGVGQEYGKQDGLIMLEERLIDEENMIIVKKGNDKLYEALNKAIATFITTQEYKDLVKKYKL